jgi:dTDP-4-amino-4,6-dideoxygalactose transaminase
MPIPLLDLKAQYLSIKPEIDAAIADVLDSQKFILGPQVKACEEAVARYSNCAHGIGVSSGTDALLISLMTENIGAGDEVITTAYSFFATAGCIARLGAKPVFVDIDPVTCNMQPGQIEARVTSRTRAILPVHLFGQMAEMDPIMDIAQRHNLVVIEDGAQAIGAEHNGRRAGSVGHYGCFSFFPSKNLGAFGDGGMVVTNDPVRAEKLRVLRAHGSKPKYYHKLVGGNFRLDTLQAAIVLAKLKHLDEWTARRQANARRYDKLFTDSGLVHPDLLQLPRIQNDDDSISNFQFPSSSADSADSADSVLPRTPESVSSASSADRSPVRHIFNQYVIRSPRRDALQAYLKEQGIGTEVYYPLPLHLQECFAPLGNKPGDYPESEKAAQETLALPIYPELTDDQARTVVDAIAGFFRKEDK